MYETVVSRLLPALKSHFSGLALSLTTQCNHPVSQEPWGTHPPPISCWTELPLSSSVQWEWILTCGQNWMKSVIIYFFQIKKGLSYHFQHKRFSQSSLSPTEERRGKKYLKNTFDLATLLRLNYPLLSPAPLSGSIKLHQTVVEPWSELADATKWLVSLHPSDGA